jgi:hypothetical protein
MGTAVEGTGGWRCEEEKRARITPSERAFKSIEKINI